MVSRSNSLFWQRPRTRMGWWAGSLGAAFLVLFLINSLVLMPFGPIVQEGSWQQALLAFYGIFMALCGLAAGFLGLVALVSRRERSWVVWLVLLPGAFMVFFLLGEFLVPH